MHQPETPTVRVVKRKWDGTVFGCSTPLTHRLAPGGSSAWAFVPAGGRRERPAKGAFDVVGGDELWVAVPGEWWILCAYLDATRSLSGYKVHASAPCSKRPAATTARIIWVDLDLDFEVTGNQLALLDEDEFHAHASTMAYPDHVVRGAWSGIATIAARYTNGDWPFDGSIQELLDGE